mgnify:CR=1 FL=1
MKDYVRRVRIVSKIFAESAVMALVSIKNDKFRTFLSLLGVSIGIFSIVAVFCAVGALKSNIDEGLSTFGSDVVYIDAWPFSSEDEEEDFKWWEYRLRPDIDEIEYNFINKNSLTAQTVSYFSTAYALAKYGGNSFSDGFVVSCSSGFDVLTNVSVEYGRYFSSSEIVGGTNVAVIGCEVAAALFGDVDSAIGKIIKIKGVDVAVIGVIKKEGSSIVSLFRKDVAVLVPLNFGKSMFGAGKSGSILVSPKDNVTSEEFQGELRQLMRAQRRLKPSQKDNFAVNTMTFLIETIAKITDILERVGWIVACFSLLIGGFGIANIMFVSVKERTSQIGIQKALGAPNYVIQTQFLVEAAVLSLAGGLMGIMTVWILCRLIHLEGFVFVLSAGDAVKGLAISLVIGILSGFLPARSAARLNPVESINQTA